MGNYRGVLVRVAAGFCLAFVVAMMLQAGRVQAQAAPQPAASAVNDPTGATTGTAKDVAVKDPKKAQEIAESRKVTIAGAGHSVTVEAPEEAAQAIGEFLSGS